MRRRHFLVSGLGLAVLAACEATAKPTPLPTKTGAKPTYPAGRPDSPLAANAAQNVWPDVITSAPAQVREAYAYAARMPEALRYVPCYCGCVGAGHRDNQACYVSHTYEGGWLVLDTHALG